jgi:cation diffusion facilitator family transporter
MTVNYTEPAFQDSRARRGNLAVGIGLLSNLLLAGLKISIGILGHSPALLADGINSTSDTAYNLVISLFVRVANKPADQQHPYGHRQLESIGAIVVGAFVITTAVAIFWDSINNVYELWIGESVFQGASMLALWAALFTVVLKMILSIYTGRVGDEIKNPSVIALAQDHRNDIFSAAAALIGIGFGIRGQFWVDPLAGAVVALIILKTGIDILRESTNDLMETGPGKTLRNEVDRILLANPEIQQIDEIHAYRFGPYLVINITVCVDGSLSVVEGDRISTWVEKALMDQISYVQDVHVHYHPAGEKRLPDDC